MYLHAQIPSIIVSYHVIQFHETICVIDCCVLDQRVCTAHFSHLR